MPAKQIGDIFKELYATRKPNEKIRILRENDSKILRELLRLNFDELAEFDLPEGDPPFKKSTEPEGMSFTTLSMEWKRLPKFMKGNSTNLAPMKKEMLFVSLLESLDPVEANLLCEVKDKRLRGITLRQTLKAFPDFVYRVKK